MTDIQNQSHHIALFKGKAIRKILYQKEWWFSIIDICGTITDSPDAGAYWRKLKQRLNEEGNEVVTFCHGLKLETSDGKNTKPTAPILRAFFVLSNQFPRLKLNP